MEINSEEMASHIVEVLQAMNERIAEQDKKILEHIYETASLKAYARALAEQVTDFDKFKIRYNELLSECNEENVLPDFIRIQPK